jgi:GNAT superfamily N-acetyltransferase
MRGTGSDPLWEILRIHRRHEREYFDCGDEALNLFLQKYARQNDERNIGRTFVAVQSGKNRVEGYYTMSSGSLEFEHLPDSLRRGLARYPIPVVTLGRLAVDRTSQGKRLGETLLLHCLRKAWIVNNQVAVFCVVVTAKTENAKRFYLKYGFQTLPDHPLHLFMPVKTLHTLFG